uniref:Uncharacterized protein n=1 Tax=Compsopogon caeruleus TaxID=31354 RepID=A0A7S1XD55_9RHOD
MGALSLLQGRATVGVTGWVRDMGSRRQQEFGLDDLAFPRGAVRTARSKLWWYVALRKGCDMSGLNNERGPGPVVGPSFFVSGCPLSWTMKWVSNDVHWSWTLYSTDKTESVMLNSLHP